MARSLSAVARLLDGRGLFTAERARILQLAAAPDRGALYKCSHDEYGGAGWSHPWPDQEFLPHACCSVPEHCPTTWLR